MPATRAPADNDPITPCKTSSAYFAADTVQDLSKSSPFVYASEQGLPGTPSAATASASAAASGIAPVWKQWLKNGKLIKKITIKKIERRSPSPKEETPREESSPATPPRTGRPASCNSLGQPAETADSDPLQLTSFRRSGTGSSCKRITTPTQRIRNAFQYKKRRYFDNEPELSSYLDSMEDRYPKGHPLLREFKRKVGKCRKGQFDTWELRVEKTRVKLRQMGVHLGSMEALIEIHSHRFVLQAIKYGLIPYVPLSPEELCQEATWPESHEFVISEKYWKYGWEDDPTYNGLHGSADTLL